MGEYPTFHVCFSKANVPFHCYWIGPWQSYYTDTGYAVPMADQIESGVKLPNGVEYIAALRPCQNVARYTPRRTSVQYHLA